MAQAPEPAGSDAARRSPIPVIQGVEQAIEGCIRDLDLRHGWPTGEGDGAEPDSSDRADLGTEPGRRLEFSGGLVVLERHADQIERSRGDEALDGGGVSADGQADAQIFGPPGGQLEQRLGLRTGYLSSVLTGPLRP